MIIGVDDQARMPVGGGHPLDEEERLCRLIAELRRMFKDAEGQGLPSPEIIEVGMRMRLNVPLAESIVVQHAVELVAPRVTPPVTPPVRNLLWLLEQNEEMGAQSIREGLTLKDRTHVREVYINPALKAGLIEMTIPNKPNSRMQKYRLTSKGKQAVLELLGRNP